MNGPCIVGIDPGSKGAIGFLWPDDGVAAVFDIPIAETTGTSRTFREVEPVVLAALFKRFDPIHVYLERIHSLPTDGVVGAFTFGDNFGSLKGVIGAIGIPLSRVAPEVWKKSLKVPKDKKQAVARARELFPACADAFTRPDRAEALLIGFYGMMHLGHPAKKRFTLLQE